VYSEAVIATVRDVVVEVVEAERDEDAFRACVDTVSVMAAGDVGAESLLAADATAGAAVRYQEKKACPPPPR
jgi:hypothetical protein